MRKIFSIIISLIIALAAYSQPSGYYNNAQGESGNQLKLELHKIIRGHTKRSYSQLWTDFQTTDKKSNGYVWDMYSDNPGGSPSYNYSYTGDQCGNYSGEGDCYNREHSFPKSWWGGGTSSTDTMYTDLFHLVPTDGYVNYKRSAYPYGEVGTASWTSTNGCKVGTSNYSGYSGTVFEPIDEYKGDFARNYFYMATRYKTRIDSWGSNTDMLDGSEFSSWALNLLLDWHQQDPVSQKEKDRNDDVYGIQNNRNPFIDHPEFVHRIWGGDDDYAPLFYDNTPSSDNIASTSFDLIVNLDETCTAYFVVLSDGASAPSSAQVKAGKDASGTVVASNLRGSITVSAANTNYSTSVSSLSTNTDYDVYVVAEDNASSSNTQSSPKKLDVTTGSGGGGGGGTNYSENFDTDANWTTGSGYSSGTYTLASPSHDDSFSSNYVVQENSYTNSANNAWRLKNTSNAYLRYECKGTVTAFSIWAARWDNSPKPQITVRYSINSGSSYSTAFTFSGDDFSGNKVYKKFSHTFTSPITNSSGNKIYIEFLTTSGERMLYDDFEISFSGGSSANDNESIIIKKSAWSEPTNIAYGTYSASSSLTTSNSIEVAKFTIKDGGSDETDSDTEPTTLTDISINVSNYGNIAALAIFNGNTNVGEETSVSSTVSFTGLNIAASDESTADFSIRATFKSSVSDNSNLKFTISSATADAGGSDFDANDAGAATTDNSGNNNKIVVTADRLAFTTNKPPSSVTVSTDFDVEVEAVDANGNRDLDATNSITLVKASGTGTLSSSSGLTKSLASGIYSWTDIQYDTDEDFTIEAQTASLTNKTSNTITCEAQAATMSDLIITEYIEGSSNNRYIEIWNNTGATVNMANYQLKIYANGSNSASSTISLSGTLADQDEYVVAHSSATIWTGTPNLTSGSLTFNGNDAIALVNTSAKGNIDVVGTIGNSAYFGKDKTLRRNGDVDNPTTTYDANDWTTYSKDNVDGLGNSGPLPIELISFDAYHHNNGIKLIWQTASETNNAFFTLERSNNISDFEEIARINAAGISNTINDYFYLDNITSSNSIFYYRLKQTDYNSKFTYSSIISIKAKTPKINDFKAYVNNSNIELFINCSSNCEINIELFDIMGRKIYSKQTAIAKGSHKHNFFLSKLSSGIYLIRLNGINSNPIEKQQKIIIR